MTPSITKKNSLFHDLLEQIIQRGVTVRHHDRSLVRKGVIQVADHLNGDICLACVEEKKQTTKNMEAAAAAGGGGAGGVARLSRKTIGPWFLSVFSAARLNKNTRRSLDLVRTKKHS